MVPWIEIIPECACDVAVSGNTEIHALCFSKVESWDKCKSTVFQLSGILKFINHIAVRANAVICVPYIG